MSVNRNERSLNEIVFKQNKKANKLQSTYAAIIVIYLILGNASPHFYDSILFTFYQLLIFLVLIFVDKNIFINKMRYSINNMKKTLIFALIGFIFAISHIIFADIIFNLPWIDISEAHGGEISNTLTSSNKLVNLINAILAVCILIPFIEEYIFRVSFLGFMVGDKPTKKWWPYLVIILVFTFIHAYPYNVSTLFLTLIYLYMSIVITLIYKFSNGNYLSVVLIHIFLNVLGTFIYPLYAGYDFSNNF